MYKRQQGFYTVTGAPFKTFVLSLSADGHFTVTEQTPGRQPHTVTWWKNGLAWNMRRGTGEDAVTTIRTRTELEPEDSVWQLVTEISKGGIVAERTCSISVSYTHLRAHETRHDLVCRLLLEKKKKTHK